MPCIQPDTRFRNGSRAAMKWHETTPNLSFGPKEVDWASSLQKTRNGSRPQTHALYPPRYLFSHWVTCVNEMARNHPKHEFSTKKSGLGMFVAKKTRNGSEDANSCLVCTPILVFAMVHVLRQNGANPPQA